uniref:Glucose dehydrogenase [FAD, quinone] n=1 Tax=Cacopsylla melanoneura TaxID=428564 RepID=A0A8D9E0E7_9HEMI
MTASKAYLKPIIDRTNLHVIKNSRVVKILIDPISKQATGVELVKNGARRTILARKEVIVSAGAFNSPKLLMLSGIGPKEHLKDLGIPLVQDLRVGDNLMEHVAYSALTFGINSTFSVVTKRLLRQPIRTGVMWIAGQGELTSTGTDGLAWIKSKYNGYKQAGPEVGPVAGDSDPLFQGNDNRIRKRDGSVVSGASDDCINTFNKLRLCKFDNNVTLNEAGRRRRALVGGASDSADVEVMFIPASFATEGEAEISFLRKTMGVPDDIYKEVYRDVINKDSWSVWIITMYPESRGSVRLASKNPWAPPLINPNFFDREIDVLRIVEGIKFVIKMSETEPFQSIGSKLVDRPIPGCKHLPFGSDEYWVCCVKQLTMQTHHQCGTCKMGPSSDPTAVVDPRLRVYGIKGLRVIDASIMPVLPGGHTVAPTYMIGEKGSDLIKEDWLPDFKPRFGFYV